MTTYCQLSCDRAVRVHVTYMEEQFAFVSEHLPQIPLQLNQWFSLLAHGFIRGCLFLSVSKITRQ